MPSITRFLRHRSLHIAHGKSDRERKKKSIGGFLVDSSFSFSCSLSPLFLLVPPPPPPTGPRRLLPKNSTQTGFGLVFREESVFSARDDLPVEAQKKNQGLRFPGVLKRETKPPAISHGPSFPDAPAKALNSPLVTKLLFFTFFGS